MPKVLIIGATGYLGNNLANRLVQNGQHTVYGIARTEAKAKQLAKQEIIPVICADPIEEPTSYLNAIRSFNIDTIVDVAGSNLGSQKILNDIKAVGRERATVHKATGVKGPKLGFIYCSGTWVHGSSNKPVNDLDLVGPNAVTPPATLVAWRVDLENAVLGASDVLDVAIIRPALLYGRESTIWSNFALPLLQAAQSGNDGHIQIPLEVESRPSLIHVDDAALGFVQAIEKLSLISNGSVYPVFDLVTSQERMSAIFAAFASTWGYKGTFELVGAGDDLFASAVSTTMRGSSDRAKQLLGWEPKRVNGFVKDMDLFAAAFAANRS